MSVSNCFYIFAQFLLFLKSKSLKWSPSLSSQFFMPLVLFLCDLCKKMLSKEYACYLHFKVLSSMYLSFVLQLNTDYHSEGPILCLVVSSLPFCSTWMFCLVSSLITNTTALVALITSCAIACIIASMLAILASAFTLHDISLLTIYDFYVFYLWHL